MFSSVVDYLEKPRRLDKMHSRLNDLGKNFKILDIGCGNHSASITKKYYPHAKYYGLDRIKDYGNDGKDFDAMERFYELDLTLHIERLNDLPNNFFDCIIISHVLEHLVNGLQVIAKLATKAKEEGYIYIEFPSKKTKNFIKIGERSRFAVVRGTFNFFDDPTHIDTFSISEIRTLLSVTGFNVIESGTLRSKKRIIFLPIFVIGSILRVGHIRASVFWDIAGFSEYIIARKAH